MRLYTIRGIRSCGIFSRNRWRMSRIRRRAVPRRGDSRPERTVTSRPLPRRLDRGRGISPTAIINLGVPAVSSVLHAVQDRRGPFSIQTMMAPLIGVREAGVALVDGRVLWIAFAIGTLPKKRATAAEH